MFFWGKITFSIDNFKSQEKHVHIFLNFCNVFVCFRRYHLRKIKLVVSSSSFRFKELHVYVLLVHSVFHQILANSQWVHPSKSTAFTLEVVHSRDLCNNRITHSSSCICLWSIVQEESYIKLIILYCTEHSFWSFTKYHNWARRILFGQFAICHWCSNTLSMNTCVQYYAYFNIV